MKHVFRWVFEGFIAVVMLLAANFWLSTFHQYVSGSMAVQQFNFSAASQLPLNSYNWLVVVAFAFIGLYCLGVAAYEVSSYNKEKEISNEKV
jgi:hypothetical protein